MFFLLLGKILAYYNELPIPLSIGLHKKIKLYFNNSLGPQDKIIVNNEME
jgi:hypothetical protein